METVVCEYCGQLVIEGDRIPEIEDDVGWAKLAAEHAPECYWVRTKALRLQGRKAQEKTRMRRRK
jgi:hypothetical protein